MQPRLSRRSNDGPVSLADHERASVRDIGGLNREVSLLERLVPRAVRDIGRFARRISACAVLFG